MIPFPKKKYKIIYADPPYQVSANYQSNNRKFLNINNYYPTMTIQQIKNLDVKSITDKDCILFMWVCDSFLKDCIDIIESWGFEYRTIGFNWIKKYKSGSFCYNFSKYTLKSHEICLIGIKGKLKNLKKTNNIKCLVLAERTIHSKKPSEVRNRIVKLCGNLPRIELFAREKTKGWDIWGNEV